MQPSMSPVSTCPIIRYSYSVFCILQVVSSDISDLFEITKFPITATAAAVGHSLKTLSANSVLSLNLAGLLPLLCGSRCEFLICQTTPPDKYKFSLPKGAAASEENMRGRFFC